MHLFEVRRARVRPQFAWLYPEIAPGVWIRASKVAQWVAQADIEKRRAPGCDCGRVLCGAHFEFRGGTRRRQPWTARAMRLRPSG